MKRAGDFILPAIALDRASRVPLYKQVQNQIRRFIRESAFEGDRLPSTRVLAKLLGVSRNTVLTAYDDLVALGVIQGRRGSGMSVCGGWADGPTVIDLERVRREAQYPLRTLSITDPDGTPLYLTY
jgi:GntR family transcriptional regulator/MocR family aminotransferase